MNTEKGVLKVEKITKFADIPQFTRDGNYHVNMDIRRIPKWIEENRKK